ncbi:FAD-binding domain-containing protein [Vararia minispora EC-137]|uniref:FAD-binding domain-containing protein n=1 Tax=Vararia minispora EC-137 TaxID=1314806 RepID=A0ACB8QXU3_9AGAM|nr:FAD-binding domain-containing protein [Vararia minispora EC-137]
MAFYLVFILLLVQAYSVLARCRTPPDAPYFPSASDWAHLDRQVDGRLLQITPSAQACREMQDCTSERWMSSSFRSGLPGQMIYYNWEQDYDSKPPELCLFNGTVCKQGDVPLFAINATTVHHVQARVGVRFAAKYDLRLSLKSSGHDFLGRSTARHSLLIWTHYLQHISFHEHYEINGQDFGSAVKVGSGVALKTLYTAAEEVSKTFVGGVAATVAIGGGYIQGGGHSAISPLLGLASDNALEFTVVLASGNIVTANEYEHSDLFWALRGGGAGSWGVIISVVLRTFPTFPGVMHLAFFILPTSGMVSKAIAIHARKIFALDTFRTGQYYTIVKDEEYGYRMMVATFFSSSRPRIVRRLMRSFVQAIKAVGASVLVDDELMGLPSINSLLTRSDEIGGINAILGSRLIPKAAYESHPEEIGQAHKKLLNLGVGIEGCVVAGGKVAENAHIDSAVNPKWRTAKAHVIAVALWPDSLSPSDVHALKERMTTEVVPILANMTGEHDSGAYSNEADVLEPDFQITFFGPHYALLSKIKSRYDPHDLFIVPGGVGSERWRPGGMCTKDHEFRVQESRGSNS